MSPKLTKDNVNTALGQRVVRLGDEFYFDEDFLVPHASIATNNGAKRGEKPIVQDGGFLDRDRKNKEIALSQNTTSCQVEGDILEARKESNSLLKKLFGGSERQG